MSTPDPINEDCPLEVRRHLEELEIRVARMEERFSASQLSIDMARDDLRRWQGAANEWRAALNDQRSQFVTLDKVLVIVGIGIAIVTMLIRFIR